MLCALHDFMPDNFSLFNLNKKNQILIALDEQYIQARICGLARIERRASNPNVGGSNPLRSAIFHRGLHYYIRFFNSEIKRVESVLDFAHKFYEIIIEPI